MWAYQIELPSSGAAVNPSINQIVQVLAGVT